MTTRPLLTDAGRFVAALAVLWICNASAAFGAPVSAHDFLRTSTPPSNSTLKNTKYFTLDTSALRTVLHDARHLEISDFPIGADFVGTLDLKPARSVFDARTKCIVATDRGDLELAAPELIVYRGVILGEAGSRVVLTYSGCGLLCSIHHADGIDFVLGQLRTSSDMTSYIFLPEADLLSTTDFTPFNCINEDLGEQNTTLKPIEEILATARSHKQSPLNLNFKGLLETEIAVEADNEFYNAAGGTDQKVLGYIGAMFAMSSMIYEDEAHITFRIPWVKLWSVADPYQVKGNAYALPDTVKSYWQSHYANVQRDVAHVMTSVGYGGGGYGWYSLCDNNQSFSVSSPQTGHSYPTFAFTYDVYIISHELGHNFGLPHSHDCYWNPPLDTCYTKDDPNTALRLGDACFSLPVTARKSTGTIMSYCANANYILSNNDFSQYKLEMTFSHRVDTVLRANAENAACITPPTDSTLILTSPRGSAIYPGDSTIAISWTYAHVTDIALSYSSDGGTTWTTIDPGTPADYGDYLWKLPNIATSTMLIRINDVAAPSIGDTSLLFFTVTSSPASYTMLALSDVIGGKINANTQAQFTWSSLGPVGLGFIQQSNDGSIWTDILSVSEGETHKGWTTPDTNILAAQFKITNKNTASYSMPNPVWIYKDNSSVTRIGPAPTVLSIGQNYPNPVRTTTIIPFDVPFRGYVTLGVRNGLGQEVASLLRETIEAGSYQVTLNAAGFPSGAYTVVLESGLARVSANLQIVH